jgi:DNA modification methylase
MKFNGLICGDNIEILKGLDDNCIDLTVTSPPYDGLRDYNGFSFDLDGIIKELLRVTKDGGVVVWVVGDETKDGNESGTSFKQALKFKELGWNLWDTMIYQKNQYPPNCMSQKRYAQVFEYMFVFSKGKVNTFNRIMRPNKLAGQKKSSLPTAIVQRNGEIKRYGKNRSLTYHDETIERNIWIYNTGGASGDKFKGKHPAIFPESLVRDHIISWSNEGDIVLDPFVGSGTTCKMAKQLNRDYIGIDISQEYIDISKERLKNE